MLANTPLRWIDPATWPWMFYVWIAFILIGWVVPVWRWFRRKRASAWPIADGRIESTDVTKANFSLTTKSGYYVAQLGYSYSVAGSTHSGLYKQEFPTEPAANDFVRDLRGKAVAIRYSPSKPSLSMVLEPDIEAVLQNRPPSGDDESVIRAAIPEWLRPFIWFFVWLSAIGLVVSLWIHIGALMGHGVPSAFWVLHVGIFIVWFPAVLVAQRLVGNTNRKDFWKAVLKGSPDWVRYMMYVLFAYEFVTFMISMGQSSSGIRHTTTSVADWRGFSSLWMVFYSAAFAILYSAAKTMESSPRCVNGHLASANAHYCHRCGQPVLPVH
jgi:Protein of unknown function (DUF3592)